MGRNQWGWVVKRPWWILFMLTVLSMSPAGAQGLETSPGGFVVREAVRIEAPPERVYHAVVHGIAEWWNPEHTFSGDATNLSINPAPGGCWCEVLPGGGGARHMTVIFVDPNRMLRLDGALGPLQEAAVTGAMTWEFAGRDGGTDLLLTYVVGGFRPGGLEPLAVPVRAVLAEQLGRLKEHAEGAIP